MNQLFLLTCAVVSLAVPLPGDEPGREASLKEPGHGPRWCLAVDEAAPDAAGAATALIGFADIAGDALEEFDRRLLAANWIMARRLEPMATRLLLGIPEKADASEAVDVIAVVNTQLERAQRLWSELAEDEAWDGDQRWRRAEALEGLGAFAATFAAVWPPDSWTEEQCDDALRRAASDLAVVLEDDRAEVAAAAALWQAYLYGRRRRLARAMELLPAALEPPRGRSADGLYARLLRCRYIAEVHDGCAATIALLARMEERCPDWFDEASEQRQAQRATALVRRQITVKWAEVLRGTDKPDRADWCERSIARIDEDYFTGDEPAELLRLGLAAPAIVDLKDAAEALN